MSFKLFREIAFININILKNFKITQDFLANLQPDTLDYKLQMTKSFGTHVFVAKLNQCIVGKIPAEIWNITFTEEENLQLSLPSMPSGFLPVCFFIRDHDPCAPRYRLRPIRSSKSSLDFPHSYNLQIHSFALILPILPSACIISTALPSQYL